MSIWPDESEMVTAYQAIYWLCYDRGIFQCRQVFLSLWL